MKINLDKKEFVKALQIGGYLAGNSKIMPILDCVKLNVKSDSIIFVSTDTENAISKRLSVGVTSDTECTFCVNMKDFMSYIKLIPDDSLEMRSDDMKTITISHKKGNFEIPILNADEFPAISPEKEYKEISFDCVLLHNWIADATKFAANDELRPQMNGMYLYSKDRVKGCCASDGHALFADTVQAEDSVEDVSFIVNRSALRIIQEVIKDSNTVNVKVGGRNAMFQVDGCSMIARIPEGRYPNFKSVIPTSNNIAVYVDKKELMDAMLRCSVGANKASMLTRMKFEGMHMDISCEDIDFNKKAVEHLAVESNGDITIGFNYSLVMEILNSITTDKVIITMKNQAQAAIFKEDKEDSNKILLLMPMMIQ